MPISRKLQGLEIPCLWRFFLLLVNFLHLLYLLLLCFYLLCRLLHNCP